MTSDSPVKSFSYEWVKGHAITNTGGESGNKANRVSIIIIAPLDDYSVLN